MSHWPFVIAAYAATLFGIGGLLVSSFVAMRRAEAAAEQSRRER